MTDTAELDERLDAHVNELIDEKLVALKVFLALESFESRGIATIEAYVSSMVDTTPGTLGGDLQAVRTQKQVLEKSLPVTTKIFEEFKEFTVRNLDV
jgi:hypothetical protein